MAHWKVDVINEALAANDMETELRLCQTLPPQSHFGESFSAQLTNKVGLLGCHTRGSDIVIVIYYCVLIWPELRNALSIVKALAMIPLRQGWMSQRVLANCVTEH